MGKSTLLLDVAAKFARTAQDVLYITGEESAAQVKLRADRIDAVAESLYLSAETDLGQALGQVEKLEPRAADRGLRADAEQRRRRGQRRRRVPGARGRRRP